MNKATHQKTKKTTSKKDKKENQPSEKKLIQRNRVKKYFLEASIAIIKEEGLENLTTKKIGDRAGYSYATIYNYFENFNELICISMIQLANECADFITANLKGDNILEVCSNFADLLVEYNATNTNIYYPFLSTAVDYSYFDNEQATHFMHPAYQIILNEIKSSSEFANIDEKEILVLMDIMTAIFHSALHFYIILKNPKTVEELKIIVRTQLQFMLEKYLN